MDTPAGLDVIGDVHGEFEPLEQLLQQLGYAELGKTWRHPEDRRAVFVGDLIDRGDGQVEVVDLARRMHDAKTALVCLGNHEWNALSWVTKDPNRPGKFLRDNDNPEKRSQHEKFLAQAGEGSTLHHEILDWFRTLPLWLDLTGLRVVHACWQPAQLRHLHARTGGSCLPTDDLLVGAGVKGSADHTAIEIVLKGIEVELPDGLSFIDKGGKVRHHARIQWWHPEPRTFRNSALVDGDEVRAQLPDVALPASTGIEVDIDPRPVVFGHYWATGTPRLQSERAVCVDYSAKCKGLLVAYRWNGETKLDAKNLVAVKA